MIGKLCILLCTMVTMVAKERHVPVRTQNRTQEACQAYVTLAKTTAYRYEPVTFSCYVSGPCETMRQPQLNWHDTEASIYIYPSPHVYEQGNQRVWCWSGVWYPQASGIQQFPRMSIMYMYERQRKGRSGMFGSMWGGVYQEQRRMHVQNTPYDVMVQPVPDAIDTVGSFGTCTWSSVPKTLSVGTTCEIHLEVAGAGNLVSLSAPEITAQDGLQWYYVGDTMEHPVHAYRRTFTYAIYMTQPGTYTIDVPSWHVFDPVAQQTYTCRPEPVEIELHGNAMASEAAEETELPEESYGDTSDPEQEHKPVEGVATPVRRFVLPMSVFFSLCAMPIACGGLWIGVQAYRVYRNRNWYTILVRRSFRRARRIIRRTRDAHAVYRACMQVFHALANVTGAHEDIVSHHVRMYAPEYSENWHALWQDITYATFSQDEETITEEQREQLARWVSFLYAQWKRTG